MEEELSARRRALRATVSQQRAELIEAADAFDSACQAALAPARLLRVALIAGGLTLTAWTLRRRRGWWVASTLWLVGRLGRALLHLPPRT